MRVHRSAKTAAAALLIVFSLLTGACGTVPPGPSATPPQPSSARPGPGGSESPTEGTTASSPPASSQPPASSRPPESQEPEKPAVNCKKLKCIALTYDDGPSPETTPKLIKILKKHDVKATFFQLGSLASQYPEIVKDIHEQGSELANHSWDHDSLDRKSVDGAYQDIKKSSAAIEKACGCEVTLMRPPYGAVNKRVDKAAKKLGVAEIFWDVDTLDWQSHDPYDIRSKVLHGGGRNSIVLMHDIHATTIKAQDELIEKLLDKGYTLVTVSELLGTPKAGKRYPKSWANYGN